MLTQYSPEKDVTYVRGFLGRMLFAGEDGVKKVKVLSGGEKVRCMLSKLMISGANVLMLDEPTDHLDMESIDALNRGMIKFPGVMIFSSRDHQIVQTTANRIMEIINGKLIDKIPHTTSIWKAMRWQERDLHLPLQRVTNRMIDYKVRLCVQNGGRIWTKGPAFSDLGRR
mgnify:CR=1 FL=1